MPRRASDIHFSQPSLTKQSFVPETDINNIMNKYLRTGEIHHLTPQKGTYGIAPSYDFREALEIVKNSTEKFDNLPSEIRTKFDNDPAKFLEYVENPANLSELVSMGLAEETPDTDTQNSQKAPHDENRASEGNIPPPPEAEPAQTGE